MTLNRNKITYNFQLGEQNLNVNWINGKPIVRQAFQLTGGNGSSTVATGLNTVMDTLITGTWAGFVTAAGWFANAGTTTNGITIDVGTGLLTVDHTGVNLTGELIFCILEYTKL